MSSKLQLTHTEISGWSRCGILSIKINRPHFICYFPRSKDIEASSVNGDMAFQAVRIQQSVVEFILNHREQIFSNEAAQIKPKEGMIHRSVKQDLKRMGI